MTTPTHLAVLDDEVDITSLLGHYLQSQGFRVSALHTGSALMELMGRDPPALVLLDLGLPGEDGFAIARQLREHWHCGLVIVTGRGDAIDKVVGLEVGADDYVTKPFSVSELVARVGALLRRSGRLDPAATLPFQFGPWSIDTAARLAANGRTTVPLSRRELDMLRLFARERGRIVSRRTLLKDVWGMRHVEHIHTRTVDMHIVKLRRKLGMTDGAPLETIRGEGYRFLG